MVTFEELARIAARYRTRTAEAMRRALKRRGVTCEPSRPDTMQPREWRALVEGNRATRASWKG